MAAMEFDLEDPLMISGDCGASAALFAAETGHMTSPAAYVDLVSRREAVSLISHAQFDDDADPFVAYLAVNYADRFLSRHRLPEGQPWIARLLAIACLSLAAKMLKPQGSLIDLQGGNPGMIFDAVTIHRMELVVLATLEWRMRSVTPFSFLPSFISLLASADPPLLAAVKSRAVHVLLKAQHEVRMMEFKPSMQAAAALLSVAHDLAPAHLPAFHAAVCCEFVDNGRVWECCGAMADVAAMGGWDGSHAVPARSSSFTPVSVLCHAGCCSDGDATSGSESESGYESNGYPDIKKPRLSRAPATFIFKK